MARHDQRVMRIAVIGTGNVGQTLGTRWGASGHEVTFGSRDPDSEAVEGIVAGAEGDVRAVLPEEASAFGEVVVLAVPGGIAAEVAGLLDVDGKPLIDCTNTLAGAPGDYRTVAEAVAHEAPGARTIKAFNTVGWEVLADPAFEAGTPSIFVCGDDDEAKGIVFELIEELGFAPVDAGGLDAAGHLERLAAFWVHLSRGHGREIAFSLLGRDGG